MIYNLLTLLAFIWLRCETALPPIPLTHLLCFLFGLGEFLPWLKVARVGHVEAPFCLAVLSFSQCFSLTIAYNLQFVIEMDLLQNCLSRRHVNYTSACAVSTEIGDCSTEKSCELPGYRRQITTITTIWKLGLSAEMIVHMHRTIEIERSL